ncbi:MAG: hypothetical protein J6U89_10095 [Bacteroidaceae bacterium]|nr:hypothetical protein [Bacteroidaceae bacterium]
MKKRIYTIVSLMILFIGSAMSQNVVLNAEIDTFQMMIGEQTRIRLELSVDTGYKVSMPELKNELMPGIEILEKKSERKSLNENRRNLFTDEYLITSFDSTLYDIPPFKVEVDSSEYLSNSLALAVYTMPIDTANLQNICGPKDVWDVELTWEEYRDSVHLGIILLFLALALAWVVVRFVKNKPIIRIVKIKPKEPSHIVALSKIEEIKNSETWQADSNVKEYYTQLTDALREYMFARFGFNATEMTTSEILDYLRGIDNKENIAELKDILETADLVKFAKLHPTANENTRNMQNAIEYVNVTKNIEEEKQEPTEKKIVNQRSLLEKRVLIASIVVIVLVLIAVIALLTTDLYNLFS